MGQKPADINSFIESEQYFPTQLQLYQFFDKYSRFNYDKGRRETWVETIDRVMNYFMKLSKNKLPQEDYDLIRKYMLELKAAPAMRVLAMGGQAAERDNTAQYNCSFSAMDSIDSMVEELHISMAGCGIGYSVERENIDKLPEIRQNSPTRGIKIHVVQDSAEGWANAFKDGLEHWFAGQHISFDYSNIRADGTPLKIKGGRASGPSHLKKLLDFTKSKIDSRRGQKLRPIDVHDIICQLGTCVVSGAVRRSALICLFDMDDKEMMECKNGENLIGNEQRWMSNNSGVWLEEPTQEQVLRQMFSMFDGERGEPGIFSRKNAYDTATPLRQAFGKKEFGTNPSLRKGTLIYTSEGILPIEKLDGKEFKVRTVDNREAPAKCFLSGKNKKLYKIVLKNGIEYYSTPEHKWPIIGGSGGYIKKETKDLAVGDKLLKIKNSILSFGSYGNGSEGFLAGWLVGDGWITKRSDNGATQIGMILSEEKYAFAHKKLLKALSDIGCSAQFNFRNHNDSKFYEMNTQSNKIDNWLKRIGMKTKKHGLPRILFTEASEEFRKGFIDGLFSSDGSIDNKKQKGYTTIVLTSSKKKILEDISNLLGFYGICGSIKTGINKAKFPNGKDYNKEYTRYDYTINSKKDVSHFRKVFELSNPNKKSLIFENELMLKKYDFDSITIKEVLLSDLEEDVWDISVYDTSHTFQISHVCTGNCGEINLRPYQFCNLTQAIARPNDTFEDLAEKIKVATIIGTIQSMATNFPNLRPIWKKNCEEERLLGVDINGQLDCAILRPSNPENGNIFAKLKEIAVETNRVYADKLGINQSASVTCVKPNGNSSLMYDVSPGLHSRWSPYYVRNVRVNAYTPMYKILKDANVPMDPENGQKAENASSWVVHFPVKSPEGAIFRNDMTALEQCEYWKTVKISYTSHNPSVTITYDKSEIIDLIQWVWNNRNIIGGMSFLPKFDAKYPQMPYEEITEEQYKELDSKFPRIPFERLAELEKEDYTEAAKELACMGGNCLI